MIIQVRVLSRFAKNMMNKRFVLIQKKARRFRQVRSLQKELYSSLIEDPAISDCIGKENSPGLRAGLVEAVMKNLNKFNLRDDV